MVESVGSWFLSEGSSLLSKTLDIHVNSALEVGDDFSSLDELDHLLLFFVS